MYRKLITLAALLILIALTIPGTAFAKIIILNEAVEADVISVDLNRKTGIVLVDGCKQCPLSLNIDKKTSFYNKGKLLKRMKAKQFSGRSGTVKYNEKNKQVISIRW